MLKPEASKSAWSTHAFRDLEEAARLVSRAMRVTCSEMDKCGKLGVHRTTDQKGSAESLV